MLLQSLTVARGTAWQCRRQAGIHRAFRRFRRHSRGPPARLLIPAACAASADNADKAAELAHGQATHQGPRHTQEDHVVVQAIGGWLYAGVFDGHNGDATARYLVKHLKGVFQRLLEEQAERLAGPLTEEAAAAVLPSIQDYLVARFLETDAQLLKWMDDWGFGSLDGGSGSTAMGVLVRRDAVVCANVGDSHVVLSRGGQAVELTVEHRLSGERPSTAEEVRRIEQVGGWVTDGRVCGILAVSRAFGDREYKGEGLQHLLERGVASGRWTAEFAAGRTFKSDPVTAEPDVAVMALREEDEFLVVATDGLWDMEHDSQGVVDLARGWLRAGLAPQEVADRLANSASVDNMGVVVVLLKSITDPEAVAAHAEAEAEAAAAAKSGRGLLGLFRR